MSDTAKRLRTFYGVVSPEDEIGSSLYLTIGDAANELDEQADEIERLRAENSLQNNEIGELRYITAENGDEIESLQVRVKELEHLNTLAVAEIERLRAQIPDRDALEVLVAAADVWNDYWSIYSTNTHGEPLTKLAIAIAKIRETMT